MRYKEEAESFGEEDKKTHKLLKYALIFLTVYVIILSLLPLLYYSLNKSGFVVVGLSAYTLNTFETRGLGSYLYTSEKYQILFSELTRKDSKPKIFIYTYSLPAFLIDLIEFSERDSSINSIPLENAKLTSKLLNENTLLLSYEFDNLTVTKTIKVDKNIEVIYDAPKPISLKLSLWRWYFKSINGLDARMLEKYDSLILRNISKISFEFEDKAKGYGNISLSQNSDVIIYRDEIGINKMIIETKTKSLTLEIDGQLTDMKTSPFIIFISRLFTNFLVMLIFPIATIIILSIFWKRWSK